MTNNIKTLIQSIVTELGCDSMTITATDDDKELSIAIMYIKDDSMASESATITKEV